MNWVNVVIQAIIWIVGELVARGVARSRVPGRGGTHIVLTLCARRFAGRAAGRGYGDAGVRPLRLAFVVLITALSYLAACDLSLPFPWPRAPAGIARELRFRGRGRQKQMRGCHLAR